MSRKKNRKRKASVSAEELQQNTIPLLTSHQSRASLTIHNGSVPVYKLIRTDPRVPECREAMVDDAPAETLEGEPDLSPPEAEKEKPKKAKRTRKAKRTKQVRLIS